MDVAQPKRMKFVKKATCPGCGKKEDVAVDRASGRPDQWISVYNPRHGEEWLTVCSWNCCGIVRMSRQSGMGDTGRPETTKPEVPKEEGGSTVH